MGVINKGTGGISRNLNQTPPSTTVPPNTVGTILHPVSGLVNDSPRSPEVLLDDADLIYNSAGRTSGVSWTNTGTLVGNDLTYVDEPLQEDHIHFPGTVGNYLSVPDSAALDLDGNTAMEIVVRIAADWMSENHKQVIVAKKGASGQSYELSLLGSATGAGTGHLMFKINNLVTDSSVQCQHPIPAIPDETLWIKVTWDGSKSRFYVAPDAGSEPATWMSIGTTYSTFQGVTGTIAANTENVYIGGDPNVGATSMLTGRIYYLALRDAIGGSDVLTIDIPTDCALTTPDVDTTFTATSGQTVTIHKSGAPPDTCRLHNTLDVTLAHPWYEVLCPASLVPAHDEIIMVWVNLNVGTVLSPATQLPLVSCFGPLPHATPTTYYQGWSVPFSNATTKVGAWVPSYYGMQGSTTTTFWSSTIGVGSEVVTTYIDRIASVRSDRWGQTTVAHDGTTAKGGVSAYYGTLFNGEVFGQNKIRVMAYEANPFNILEVGIKKLSLAEYPLAATETSATLYEQDSKIVARAALGLEPHWDLDETFYVSATGTPTWIGETITEGTWVRSTSANNTAESAVVWASTAQTGLGWLAAPGNVASMIGSTVTITDTEHMLAWAIVSAPFSTEYRDIFNSFDSLSYLNLAIQIDDPDDGTGFPYIFVEVDGPGGYQWGELYEDPTWRLPNGGYENPHMFAIYLKRNLLGDDQLYFYVSGQSDWIECTNQPTFVPGTISFPIDTLGIAESSEMLLWGWGIDRGTDVSMPSVVTLTNILETVKSRNNSY